MAMLRKHWKITLLNCSLILTAVGLLLWASSPRETARTAQNGEATDAAKSEVVPEPRPQRAALDARSNVRVKSVLDAATEKNHPERLSPMLVPERFDEAAYRRNPRAYLDVVEPGRVWDTKAPAEDVKVIETQGGSTKQLKALASVELSVKSEPNAPVTFTSMDLGEFPGGRTSITVEADEKGVATTTFTASAGTTGPVNVLAASPMTADQARFRLWVEDPNAVEPVRPDGEPVPAK